MSIEHRTSSKLSSYTWQHVAVTMDSGSSTIEFYVDGKRIETTRMSESTIATNDHAIVIGKSPDARFHGAMDDVRVYNRALRSDEIAHIVRAADESALSLRYDFENCMECHGEIKFRDSGPYGYDGLCRNTGAQCDAITTDPGEFVVGSSAYRTLEDQYIEIQINDESDRLQGEHLRACTFAGWIKLAVGHGAWEPVITKEGVFSFGVRDGRPSLLLGTGPHSMPYPNIIPCRQCTIWLICPVCAKWDTTDSRGPSKTIYETRRTPSRWRCTKQRARCTCSTTTP